jgi:predicted Rossmann-fold nucleotide-binding protein
MGKDYWQPMLDYLRSTMVQAGTIANTDVDRLLLTDDPQMAVDTIREAAKRRFGLSLRPLRKPQRLLGEALPQPAR